MELFKSIDNAFFQKNKVHFYGSEHSTYDIINDYLENNQSDQAFFLIDLGEIAKAYDKWTSCLPDVKPYYAVKCNPNLVLLEFLAQLGCNFDCASENEIKTIVEITADPSRIIFANPCKMSSQIRYARANDVDLMTFDCEEELYKIKLYHPYAKLILRLAVDDTYSECRFNRKFGCKIEEVETLLTIGRTLKLDIVGFSFHVGSGCFSGDSFYSAIKDCRKATDIAKAMGIHISIIDMGGGFPGVPKSIPNRTHLIQFEDIASRINDAIHDHFSKEIQNKTIRFIAEPGRYFAQKSHILVLNVIGKKIVYEKEEKGRDHLDLGLDIVEELEEGEIEEEMMDKGTNDEIKLEKKIIYYLNDGVYGSFNCIFFDHTVPTILPFNERDERLYKTTIFGPTCDSIDIISEDVLLPELAIGEWVYVEDFGAYTAASSSAFNGFKTSMCKYIFKS